MYGLAFRMAVALTALARFLSLRAAASVRRRGSGTPSWSAWPGPAKNILLGGSGGLIKWIHKGDNLGYYMGYRGY